MRKLLIFAGALLFAAVFMSGCITETPSDDPVVGIWYTEEDLATPDGLVFASHTYVFAADGTGFSLAEFDSELVYGKIEFTWKNAGDGKYALTAADTKNSGVPQDMEFVLSGDTFTSVGDVSITYHRSPLADYAVGLWTGVRADYEGYTDIQVLLYLGADGTGNLAVYGPDVLNLDEVFTSDFTWDVRENNVVLLGPNGGSFELSFVGGDLVFATIYPIHKYTIEDNLYGLWKSDKPGVEDGVSYDIVQIIKSDGTGVEIWTVPGSDAAARKYSYTWKMDSPISYEAVYDDGDTWTFGSINLKIFDGGLWYSKVGFDVLSEYAQNKVTA